MTILFIEKHVPDLLTLINSLNYSALDKLNRISYIYHNDRNSKIENIIKNAIEKNSSCNFDIITCNGNNIYNYDNVRTTSNIIGSTNWSFENGESVRKEYFTDNIDKWNEILGVDVSADVKDNKINGIKYNYITATYELEKNIIWPYKFEDDNFIVLTNGEIFDGNNFSIDVTIDGRGRNKGLFLSNVLLTGTTPIVKNLIVKSTISDIGSGGIFRTNSNNFIVSDCKHIGILDDLGNQCGGIVGADCNNFSILSCKQGGNINSLNSGGMYGGIMINNYAISCVIDKCIFKGIINANNSAGIFGNTNILTKQGTGIISIHRCKSNGVIIGDYSAGISASNFGNGQTSTIKKCKYKGSLNGLSNGGICSNNSMASIKICKSTCDINGNNSGGICGQYTGGPTGNIASLLNCFHKGKIIGNNCGGLIGSNTSESTSPVYVCEIIQSISSGDILGIYSGGILGSNVSKGNVGNICTIKNSIYKGNIVGSYSGGIFSTQEQGICGILSIENSYVVGNINDNCAGVCNTLLNLTVSISNVYAFGLYSKSNAGGILEPPTNLATTNSVITYPVNTLTGTQFQTEPVGLSNVTLLNVYSYDLRYEGTYILGKINKNCDNLPKSIWIKSKKYPKLKSFLSRPWKEYKQFNILPRLHF